MLSSGAVQTTYNRYINVGIAGMPATETGWDISTRLFEDLVSPPAGLPFGVVVSQGTKHGDRSVCLGTLSGRSAVGISARDVTLAKYQLTNPIAVDRYADGDNAAIMVRGDIWVAVSGSVAPGGQVFFNASTGVIGASGTVLTGATFLTTAPLAAGNIMKNPTGQLAVVRLVALGQF